MTTPQDEASVRSALERALAEAQRTAPSVEPGDVRRRARRWWRRPRLDVTITIAVAAVLVLALASLLVGPLRPGHGHRGPRGTTRPATTPVPTGTMVEIYQPFTAAGTIDPDIDITAHAMGICFNGETSRTYRCFGNTVGDRNIFDPCFAGPQGTRAPLVCPGDPRSRTAVAFTATSVSAGAPSTATTPWAIELSNGTTCAFVNAAWGGLGPYDCQYWEPSSSPADCHVPQEGRPTWTVQCQTDKTDASPFTSYTVVTVWH